MRLALLAIVFSGATALAQGDPCTLACGETMGQCAQRCGSEQRCAQRCVKQMDDCNQRCVARGKVQTRPDARVTMCPGADGKPVPCGEFTDTKAPPPKKKKKQHTMKELEKAGAGP